MYGRYRDVVPNERALYHLVPARWFNAQLPIGAGRDGYVTEDFHVLGGIETFRDLDKLLAHANEQLAEQRGYFYVMQLDFDHPEAIRRDARREKTEEKKNADANANAATTRTDGSDSDGSDSKASAGSFVMVPDPCSNTSRVSIPEPDRETGMVFVRAAVDVDCVQRVYVASRAAEASRRRCDGRRSSATRVRARARDRRRRRRARRRDCAAACSGRGRSSPSTRSRMDRRTI